jgi:hypothetical protein
MRFRAPGSFFEPRPNDLADRIAANRERTEARNEVERLRRSTSRWRREMAWQIDQGIMPVEAADRLATTFSRIAAAQRRMDAGVPPTDEDIIVMRLLG